MKEWLKQVLKSDGEVSWMRVMGTFVIFDIMIQWNIACAKHGFDFIDFPWGAVSILGIAFGTKAIQSFGEKKQSEEKEAWEDDNQRGRKE